MGRATARAMDDALEGEEATAAAEDSAPGWCESPVASWRGPPGGLAAFGGNRAYP